MNAHVPARDGGFTIIEVMVAALILMTGALGILASLDAFRSTSTSMIAREAATHEAEKQIEILRGIGYRRLVLTASPGAPAGPKDPRQGISGTSYRPSTDAALAPMVIDGSAEGAIPPSVPWSSGDASGTVYRFITQEPAGTAGCGQICPKRVSIGVTFTVRGAMQSVVMSTLVADPQFGAADETSTPTAKPAACPCWTTFYLYDTPAASATRQTQTGDHVLHTRDDYPDLMGTDPPPNPYENALTAPFEPTRYRYGTDAETLNGLGLTYPGGALITHSASCNGGNGNSAGNKLKSARWSTRPVLQNTVLHGDAVATMFTQMAGALSTSGTLCFTFYDWVIDGTGKIGSKTQLSTYIYSQNPWPSAAPDQIDTGIFRYLGTGVTRTLVAGHALGVEVTVDNNTAGAEAVFYDHPNLASTVQVSSTPAF